MTRILTSSPTPPKHYPSPKPSSKRHADTAWSQPGRQEEEEGMTVGGAGVSGTPLHSPLESKLLNLTLEKRAWVGGGRPLDKSHHPPLPAAILSFFCSHSDVIKN